MINIRIEQDPAAEAYHPKADTQDAIPGVDPCPRGGGRIPVHPVILYIRGEVVCLARAAAVVSVTHQTGFESGRDTAVLAREESAVGEDLVLQ